MIYYLLIYLSDTILPLRYLSPNTDVFPLCFWRIPVSDTPVTCIYGQDCVLPCSFQGADDELVIHWQQLAKKRMVHSYHSGEDQLGNQDSLFRGRTSLSHDQITNGNASLKLTGVTLQDEGRYQCYTSNAKGNVESFDMVSVKGRSLFPSLLS